MGRGGLIVYRLTRKKYHKDISGRGAEIAGGRWNSKGVRVLYTGENRALCTAEIAVHTPLGITPVNYILQTIQLPKTTTETINIKTLPKKWRAFPYIPSTKKIGNDFIVRNESLVLKVPSAVVQGAYNYLINPFHKMYLKVKIIEAVAFGFDKRLFGEV